MIEVYPDPDALAHAVAEHVVTHAERAIATSGRFVLALSGGSTPQAAYVLLAGDRYAGRVEWTQVHVLWGDERCVPPDDGRSNFRMARESLLDFVPVPPTQVHRIRGEDPPAQAAAEYERRLRQLLGHEGADGPPSTGPDLALLGMGEDGHTASLFPGHPAVAERVRWVVAIGGGETSLGRITLTPVVLNAARAVTFVVAGVSKAERLHQVLEGPFMPDQLPAQRIRPSSGEPTWMVELAAASRLTSVRS